MKQRNKKQTGSASVRAAAREAAIGKGRPGQFNPNRSVRFASRATDKRAARGRTWRGE